MPARKERLFIDLTKPEDSDEELYGDITAPPENPDGLTPTIQPKYSPPKLKPNTIVTDRNSDEDFYDELYLERMLTDSAMMVD